MIDLAQARELLPRAVATQGRDFIYNPNNRAECRYEPIPHLAPNDPRGKTGCLVGVALDLAGETRHHGFGDTVHELQAMYPDMMTPDAAEYFGVAQSGQDIGFTWGQSHDDAETYLTNLGVA